ncbi:MAG TPA: hypothetical protein VNT52_18010, partial [Acidimicrobiales bacterium]|nr:hypothetical protein [Acidimicrobiales bacterium]
WSSSALARAADDGPLFINPIIYAEVSVRFSRIEDVEEALPPSGGVETLDFDAAPLLVDQAYRYTQERLSELRLEGRSTAALHPA